MRRNLCLGARLLTGPKHLRMPGRGMYRENWSRDWKDLKIFLITKPLQPGRDAARMYADLSHVNSGTTVALFFWRILNIVAIARRCQLAQRYPYAEVRDNTICASMMPIDLLRANFRSLAQDILIPDRTLDPDQYVQRRSISQRTAKRIS